MKAERRHDLRQNDLASKIIEMPNITRFYIQRIAIVFAVILVISLFIFSRIQRSRQSASDARELLALARNGVQEMDRLPHQTQAQLLPVVDARYMQAVQHYYDDAKQKLDQFAERSSDKLLTGQAALLRGDLNLTLASTPIIPGATTQPSLDPQPSREEAFKLATDAYNDVINKFGDQHTNVVAARLGLATIALDHRDFKSAEDYLKAVANDEDAAAMFRESAKRKIDAIQTMKEPVIIAVKPIPPLPTTAPWTPR